MGWLRVHRARTELAPDRPLGAAARSASGACPPWGRETGSPPAAGESSSQEAETLAERVEDRRGALLCLPDVGGNQLPPWECDFPPRGAPPLSCLRSLRLSCSVSVLGSEASWAQSQREFVLEVAGELPPLLKPLPGLIKTALQESALDPAEEAQPAWSQTVPAAATL